MGGIAASPIEVPAAANHELVVVAAGSTLVVLKTADLSVVSTFALDGDIRDASVTVTDVTGKLTTFVTTAAGTVGGVRPLQGSFLWQRNLRRAGCADDHLTAGPLVHVRQSSSAAFKAQFATDLVYLATDFTPSAACPSGSTTSNRVVVLQAIDGLPVWVFNETATYGVDGAIRHGSLDAAADRLFLATKRGASAVQHTVWAIDLLTGAPAWSANAGAIENSPVLLDDRVLVASRAGLVSALSRATGGLIWKLQMGQPYTILTMTAAKLADIGRAVCVVMGNGHIRLIRDNGDSGAVAWDVALPGGRLAKSRPVYEPGSNMFYVGADDSQVYQIDASSGAVTANRFVEMSGTGVVGDPVIWTSGGVTRLVAGSSASVLAEFLLPWPREVFGQ